MSLGCILFVISQFDWLCDVCGCVMSPTSGIYWVELGFINNYKETQLWLILLRYCYIISCKTLLQIDLKATLKKCILENFARVKGGSFLKWCRYFTQVSESRSCEIIKELNTSPIICSRLICANKEFMEKIRLTRLYRFKGHYD